MIRHTPSLTTPSVQEAPHAAKNDLVIPFVLWNQVPHITVTCLHVFPLPASPFRPNDTKVGPDGVETAPQLCVLAGTEDGLLFYWRLAHDRVLQVNVLVFPAAPAAPMVGLGNGTNGSGQHCVISATRDGAVATWHMPSGACQDANAQLASEIAPLIGLEMLSNCRYALLVSQVTRLLIVDTWHLELLLCVDTAQEQLRRGLTVGEHSVDEHLAHLILSYGAQGLVKCFQCDTTQNKALLDQWRVRTNWVLSWADAALDITCAQSTSLKDGDTLHPQTALLGSIHASYFPLMLQLSPSAALVLVVWTTKFAILQRSWLDEKQGPLDQQGGICRLDPATLVHQMAPPTSLESISWANGAFWNDETVLLWTTSGHLFSFSISNRLEPCGKFYLFTKTSDQLVPRSEFHVLGLLPPPNYITHLSCCQCCNVPAKKWPLESNTEGLTTWTRTGKTTLEMIHMCRRGTFKQWQLRRRQDELVVEEKQVHSLDEGFPNERNETSRCSLTHLILGRDDMATSSVVPERRRKGSRSGKKRRLTTSSDYLLDIPLLVKGYMDGTLSIGFLRDELAGFEAWKDRQRHVTRHQDQVTALAHYRGAKATSKLQFRLFSGAKDGSLHVSEVQVSHLAANPSHNVVHVTSGPLFRAHRGPIEHISLSPEQTGQLGPDRWVATFGRDRRVVVYAPCGGPHDDPLCPDYKCLFEFPGQGDDICRLSWQLARGLLFVEAQDGMVSVWSLDTGVLERVVPCALISESEKQEQNDEKEEEDREEEKEEEENDDERSVKSILWLGQTPVQLVSWNVLKSAIQLKSNWTGWLLQQVDESPAAYASGSLDLVLFSLLFSWGMSPSLDASCQSLLGLAPVQALYSCALKSVRYGTLTLPLPSFRPWLQSSALSATLSLGLVSFCLSCMEFGPKSDATYEQVQGFWSQVITHHLVVLPESVAGFCEPELELVATFGFASCPYTQLAARTVLTGVLKRLNRDERSVWATKWTGQLQREMLRLGMETGSWAVHGGVVRSGTRALVSSGRVLTRLGALVLLLSLLGTLCPGEIAPSSARQVCDVLVLLLHVPERPVASVAAELLTKGLLLFRPHFVDLSSLLVQLLLLDVHEQAQTGGPHAARSLLLEVGASEAAFVLGFLQQEMHVAERPRGYAESLLLLLLDLLTTQYVLLYRHLTVCVDTILASLDPTKPARRRQCLVVATRCLHALVQRFPMVDFHQETQKLALGTRDAVIVLYDVRTATKWRVLDGHAAAISVVRFRTDGQVLVSYAARERCVRWWNSGNAGLFGGMLNLQPVCLKEQKLTALQVNQDVSVHQILHTCRFQFLPRAKEEKKEEKEEKEKKEKEKKEILRLTREDASQVHFLL